MPAEGLTPGAAIVLQVADAGEAFAALPADQVWVVLHAGRRAIAVEWTWDRVRQRLPADYEALRQAHAPDRVIYIPEEGPVELVQLHRGN